MPMDHPNEPQHPDSLVRKTFGQAAQEEPYVAIERMRQFLRLYGIELKRDPHGIPIRKVFGPSKPPHG